MQSKGRTKVKGRGRTAAVGMGIVKWERSQKAGEEEEEEDDECCGHGGGVSRKRDKMTPQTVWDA